MPTSLRLQERFGDDLQVLLVEVQGASARRVERFALDRRWLGGSAMWTTERPFTTGVRTLPHYVLVGADGRVIEKGGHVSNNTAGRIEKEIAAARLGPEGTPEGLRPAWAAFADGEVQRAIDLASAEAEKAEHAVAARTAIDAFRRSIGRTLDRAEWCLAHGYWEEALALLDPVRRGLGSEGELAVRLRGIDERLASDALKQEREAAPVLRRILEPLHAEGFDRSGERRRALEKLIADFPTTGAAARARHLVEL